MNENSISPKLLSTQKDFEALVFEKFSDVLTGDLSKKFDKKDVNKILTILSALQPVNISNPTLLEKISSYTNIRKHEVTLIISELESAGILLEKAHIGLMITPDVFSDYILSESWITRGYLTGYADEVFDEFYDISPSETISNIAELDWRVQSDGTKVDVMSCIWEKILIKYKQGSNMRRFTILEIVKKIAYIQPSKTLDLIDFALTILSSENESMGIT